LAVVGVPDNTPEDVFRVTPAGKAPLARLNVNGLVPPDMLIVWLYAVPTVPPGNELGDKVTPVQVTTTVYDWEPVQP
jgi:hypothetical protein